MTNRKKRKSTVTSMKKTADGVLSNLIRLSAADHEGYCECVTCGKSYQWKLMDAGHYIGRRHNGTRYDRRNVNQQCRRCNRGEEGRLYEYGKYLTERYGEGITDDLREQANSAKRFTIEELKEMVAEWREELRGL
jgi:hypothetical protein